MDTISQPTAEGASIRISRWEGNKTLPGREKSNIKIIATSNYQEFSFTVAEQIKNQIKEKRDSRLALPAGHSPRGYYDLLARDSQKSQIDWQQVKCFALDDYLNTDEINSFQHFLQTHLYRFTNLSPQAIFNPRFCDDYDQLIANNGGIDFCLLGLGVNGHIAFNEPPTCVTSWTHCVFLTEKTREVNKGDFIKAYSSNDAKNQTNSQINNHDAVVPERAVTIGIATVLASKRIVLAVSGEHKRSVLAQALSGQLDPMLPASYLTTHKNLLVITDFAFAL